MTDRPASSNEPTSAQSLSVIFPAYNEESRIASTLREAVSALERLNRPFQILIVDDGSSDRTPEIARSAARDHDQVEVLSLPHRGKASAVFEGMRAADGDLILFSDADLATPLSYVKTFVDHAASGADVVIASREGLTANRIGEPHYRHVMGRIFNQLVQWTLLPGIEDTQCGFKLFSREAAHDILERSRIYRDQGEGVAGARVTAFDVELLVIARRLGYSIEVVPVDWTYGTHSKVNPITDSLCNVRDIALVKWNDLRGRYSR